MKIVCWYSIAAPALLLTTSLALAGNQDQLFPSDKAGGLKRAPAAGLVVTESGASQRSIIIVSGKNTQPGSLSQSKFKNPAVRLNNPGSKVMLNPQPLPPKSNPNGSKVMLNPQPLPTQAL
jgi:hypothetical protein